ncbi:MAG: 4-deoxy-4-formamido-L-arabinose-phosphoundecaprenol deformylase [Verrucomicrobia bacterium]|nr:MAG: 4-deoxy-4-formamido-L-arabinose-phosphoundecaprenol deformylase [Verrucomicrobiota bacterium]
MKLAIKIDVDTYRGTRDGVPALAKLLKKRAVPATFLFSFGPDNTGKALRRIFRKGFLKKCLRSNVAGNYGIRTLLYGTLLPAPKIARLCSAQMAAAASDGFECGIHCWDHFKWQDYLFAMRDTEIEAEFSNARAEFEKVFGAEAKCCGAPGWQISPAALEVEDAANLLYASDVRGEFPFIPKMGGRTFKTIQIPSTLPTLDEVLGTVKIGEVAEMHFAAMREREYSVLTAHAELEGMAYLEWFDKFISEARGRGVEFYPLETRARELSANRSQLPVCEIEMSPFPGRSGLLAVQKPQTQAPR